MFASIIMFVTAVVFVVVGALIFGGKKELIHDYHRKNVTDSRAYCRAMGLCTAAIGVSAAASGTVLLLAKDAVLMTLAGFAVFILGFALSLIFIVRTQKKYNGGML